MTHSSRFTAGCAGSPVSDWRLYDATYSERSMGLLRENSNGYEKSAPLSSAASLKGRLLMTHGLSDVNVHPQNTFKMADALVRAGIPFDMMVYPRQVHGFTDAAAPHVYNKFVDHLKRYLLDQNEK
jgi:dipeptidyl-peptidase-4